MNLKDFYDWQKNPRTVWWFAFSGLVIVLLTPLMLVQVPALLDYPNHLARMYILAHPEDRTLRQFYSPAWGVIPYIAMDALSLILQHFVSIYTAGRIILALAVLAPLVGSILYARANFGRAHFWHLSTGMFCYNTLFLMGFFNFCISSGLALMLAATWILYRDRFPIRTVIFSAIGAALLFFVHIYGAFFYVVLIASRELSAIIPSPSVGDFLRSGLKRSLPLVLTAVPLFILSSYSGDMQSAGSVSV